MKQFEFTVTVFNRASYNFSKTYAASVRMLSCSIDLNFF